MEAVVLIGGLLYIAAAGYFVMDRLGRFLDRGGISPQWDDEDARLSQSQKTRSPGPKPFPRQAGCNAPHSKVV